MQNSSHDGRMGEGPLCRCPCCACVGTTHTSAQRLVPSAGASRSTVLVRSDTGTRSAQQNTRKPSGCQCQPLVFEWAGGDLSTPWCSLTIAELHSEG
jgi:hypothetical protein